MKISYSRLFMITLIINVSISSSNITHVSRIKNIIKYPYRKFINLLKASIFSLREVTLHINGIYLSIFSL